MSPEEGASGYIIADLGTPAWDSPKLSLVHRHVSPPTGRGQQQSNRNEGGASLLPVASRDHVVDGRLVLVGGVGSQTVGPGVGEEQPVAHAQLGQEAALHHLVQPVHGRPPQTTGEQWLLGGHHLWAHTHSMYTFSAVVYGQMQA